MALRDVLKNLRGDDWLGPLYADWEAAQADIEHWEDPVPFVRPSVAGGNCEREMQLYQLGHRTDFGPQITQRMRNGDQVHDRITANFEEMGLLHSGPLRGYAEENGVARTWEADLVVRHPQLGTHHLGEIKSMNHFRYGRLPDQEDDPVRMARAIFKVEPKYARQLTQYLVLFQRHYPELEIQDDAFFLFENTNNQAIRFIWVKPDEELRFDAFKLANISEEATVNGELIEPPFTKGSIVCRKCDRESICYALQDGDKEVWKNVNERLIQASTLPTK